MGLGKAGPATRNGGVTLGKASVWKVGPYARALGFGDIIAVFEGCIFSIEPTVVDRGWGGCA